MGRPTVLTASQTTPIYVYIYPLISTVHPTAGKNPIHTVHLHPITPMPCPSKTYGWDLINPGPSHSLCHPRSLRSLRPLALSSTPPLSFEASISPPHLLSESMASISVPCPKSSASAAAAARGGSSRRNPPPRPSSTVPVSKLASSPIAGYGSLSLSLVRPFSHPWSLLFELALRFNGADGEVMVTQDRYGSF